MPGWSITSTTMDAFPMTDILLALTGAGAFALLALYVAACEHV